MRNLSHLLSFVALASGCGRYGERSVTPRDLARGESGSMQSAYLRADDLREAGQHGYPDGIVLDEAYVMSWASGKTCVDVTLRTDAGEDQAIGEWLFEFNGQKVTARRTWEKAVDYPFERTENYDEPWVIRGAIIDAGKGHVETPGVAVGHNEKQRTTQMYWRVMGRRAEICGPVVGPRLDFHVTLKRRTQAPAWQEHFLWRLKD